MQAIASAQVLEYGLCQACISGLAQRQVSNTNIWRLFLADLQVRCHRSPRKLLPVLTVMPIPENLKELSCPFIHPRSWQPELYSPHIETPGNSSHSASPLAVLSTWYTPALCRPWLCCLCSLKVLLRLTHRPYSFSLNNDGVNEEGQAIL